MRAPVIPTEHFHDVCKPGHGPLTCRYITAGADGICCEKHTPLGRTLDARVAQMNAKGDNCEGLKP